MFGISHTHEIAFGLQDTKWIVVGFSVVRFSRRWMETPFSSALPIVSADFCFNGTGFTKEYNIEFDWQHRAQEEIQSPYMPICSIQRYQFSKTKTPENPSTRARRVFFFGFRTVCEKCAATIFHAKTSSCLSPVQTT